MEILVAAKRTSPKIKTPSLKVGVVVCGLLLVFLCCVSTALGSDSSAVVVIPAAVVSGGSTSLVPRYTFTHSDVVFVGLQSGDVISLDAKTGAELWRLETGGPMISHEITTLPTAEMRTHPFGLPFAVKGLWLHTRDPTSSTQFSDQPFLHLNQLLQRPHFRMMDNVDVFTTTSAESFDVADTGLLKKGQRPVSTSPVVHVIRYNVHIRVRQVHGFEWNVTVGSLKVAISPPSNQVGSQDAFSKRQTFHSSRNMKRGHIVVDAEVGGLISYVINEKLLWSKSIKSSPVAAFRWSEHLVENIDLLGSDTNRVLQLTMPDPSTSILRAVIPDLTGPSGAMWLEAPELYGPPFRVSPAFDYEKQYAQIIFDKQKKDGGGANGGGLTSSLDHEVASLTRMTIFFCSSILTYLLSVLGICAGVSQRNKLRQAWGQLDQLQCQLKEQQRVNAEMPAQQISPGLLLPSRLDSASMFGREDSTMMEDSHSWDFPATSDGGSSLATMKDTHPPVASVTTSSLLNLHFNLFRQIGSGGGGVIFEAKSRLTNTIYAIKMIALLHDPERIKREAVLHSKLEHKNVVRFNHCWIEKLCPETKMMLSRFDAFLADDDDASCISSCPSARGGGCGGGGSGSLDGTMTSTASTDDGSHEYIFIQMEYFKSGTLFDYLTSVRGRNISRAENLDLILMIVRGLEYLHDSGVVHRDLKPTNIFLTDDFVAKIGDFGLSYTTPAKNVKGGCSETGRYNTESLDHVYANEAITVETLGLGSPLYSSPEQLDSRTATAASDVFALGVLSYELYHHFGGTAHERIDTLQKLREKKLADGFEDEYPEEAALFLSMTRGKPNKRPTIKEVHDTVKRLIKQVRHGNNELNGSRSNETTTTTTVD